MSTIRILVVLCTFCCSLQMMGEDKFPDGKLIPGWFRNQESVNINLLRKHYQITEYDVINDSTKVQTK